MNIGKEESWESICKNCGFFQNDPHLEKENEGYCWNYKTLFFGCITENNNTCDDYTKYDKLTGHDYREVRKRQKPYNTLFGSDQY